MNFDRDRANWRKSIRSNGQGGNCVEVATGQALVGVRDSKDPNGPALTFEPGAFAAFVASAKSGAFDLDV